MAKILAMSALVVILAGCATTAGRTARPTPGDTLTREHLRENVMRDCMKQRGFAYIAVPRPGSHVTDEGRRRAAGDYAAVKTHRGKYGFAVFSALVYPTSQEAGGMDAAAQNPNDKIVRALSAAQQGGYRKARDTCFSQAARQVYGKDVKGFDDFHAKYAKAYESTVLGQLDADPELVPLAQRYANCLRAQGVRVDSAKPSAVGEQAGRRFYDELFAIGRKQHPTAAKSERWWPDLSPAQARPYLDREIRAALADLECGKEFFPVAAPKKSAASARFDAEWGMP